MPIRQIPGTDVQYFLTVFDEQGVERREADGTLLSDVVRQRVADAASPITDVFFTSHGWKGDVPAAIEQYDAWVGAMAKLEQDRAEARRRRKDFRPLIVGLHWPSLPWGDEAIPQPGRGGLLSADDDTLGREVEAYAKRIADTSAARAAIRTILEDARTRTTKKLPKKVKDAYATLFTESGLETDDRAAKPGADQPAFDPDAIIAEAGAGDAKPKTGEARAATTPGVLGGFGGLGDKLGELFRSPLRQLSFWKMKDRARSFGESGGHELLRSLQQAAPKARFHLMGHSFGCIVVSATVAGGPNSQPLPRPVDSLFLVQGALSLWAYAKEIPFERGTAGYFNRIIANGLVRGPIVTTRSTRDTAVGKLYPLGAKVKKQLVLGDDDLPRYGGIGSFGVQGMGALAADLPMGAATSSYGFKPGRVYNLEASKIIKNGDGASGAHSDIAHPEVAHAFWQAILAEP